MAGSVSIACGITVINNVDTGRSGYPLLPAFYSLAVHYYDEDDIDVGRPLDCRVVVNHTIVLTEEEQREAHEQALRKATDEAYAKITHKSKSQPASNAANAANQQSLF